MLLYCSALLDERSGSEMRVAYCTIKIKIGLFALYAALVVYATLFNFNNWTISNVTIRYNLKVCSFI